MKFCPMCGSRLVEGARFCAECGAALTQIENKAENKTDNKTEYKTVTVNADDNTCRYCGMVLSTMSPVCPACGREVQSKSSGACREFLNKLDEIESGKYIPIESTGFENLLSAVSNTIPIIDDPIRKKAMHNEMQAEERKLEYIKNFRVPNNKADMLEFIALTEHLSEVNKKEGFVGSRISQLFRQKCDETYQRASQLMPNDPDFLAIKAKRDAIEEEKRMKRENSFAGRLSKKIKKSLDDFIED